MGREREHDRPLQGEDGFWEPVRSNVVDCFQQFFDYVLPRESLAVVRLVAYCLRERLAWCDVDGTPRAPREVVRLLELDEELSLDRKSVRAALQRACEAHYIEPIALPEEQGGGAGFRLKLDLERYTVEEHEFVGFYPLPTHRIRVPLEFFTTVVSQETLATIKVVACIIRLTLGSIDNLGRADVSPAISQQQFVRRMNMGRRQAIQGVQAALVRNYIRRLEQGSLETGRPSTYGLYWRRAPQALAWPEERGPKLPVVSLGEALGKRDQSNAGKRDQGSGKKGSGEWEKGIRGMGKGDQESGKKGSGAFEPIDLLKDPDLRSRSRSAASSSAPTAIPTLVPKAAAAAGELCEQIRSRFPLGNPQLIARFVGEKPAHVAAVLSALDEVDPAFVRRFTRSADPVWAVFHTCCLQGILPPRRAQKPASPSSSPAHERRQGSAEEDAKWQGLDESGRLGALLRLWQTACWMKLGAAPSDGERAGIEAALAERLRAGQGRIELEAWVLEEVAKGGEGPFVAPWTSPTERGKL